MAQLPDDLLQEVQAFLGGPLADESGSLSAACDQQRKCLLRKLLSIAVGAAAALPSSAVYLDMNGVKSNNKRTGTSVINTTRRSSTEDDVDNPKSTLNNGSLDTPKFDTCTACSVCTGCDNLFPCGDSQRDPSALEAKMSAELLRCGVVWRLWAVPLPLLGRRRRRCWAALFPGRLLLFASQRSSRPRTVLPLRVACSAAYSARLVADSILPNAIELCCPGRKTHQILASDNEDARAWLDAIRLAGCVASKSKQNDFFEPNTCSEDPAPSPTPTTNGTATAVSHCESDAEKTPQSEKADTQQYEPMSSAPDPPPPLTPDDIYHDIAPPATPPPSPPNQPQYENGEVLQKASVPVNAEEQERPVYDDVGQLHLYKNVPTPTSMSDTSQEIVYDDVGMMNGIPTQGPTAGALYELIDDNTQP